MQKSSLFHHKTIKKLCEKTDLTYKQIEASRKWLGYLDAGDLEKEKSNYPIFMKTILQDILGFPMEDIGQEDENVDMLYPKKGEKVLCVECKGTGTAELGALQHRAKKEHETPIKQTWDYVGSTGSDYGICTNYKEFVLMTRNDYPHMHWFDFESIRENKEKLKEFVGIFSKESLIDNGGFVEDLHKESIEEEREFTTEFYKLFHQTRLMMIQAFQEKEGVTKDEAIDYAQLYLNRLIFIFFAEDNKFLEKKLFMETVKKSLNSNIFESSKSVSNQILDLFKIMDEGSDRLGIVGFGGGLFQERIPSKIYFLDLRDKKSFNDITNKIKLKIKPDDTIQSLIDRERKLNPIIKNLLMMDSFDFTTELNVNILGQVFEQSISDLEELKEEKVSRRKKDGVYYTPEYITDYICRNTIIPYLSKSGTNSIQTLIYEHENNIEELEKKFREIKILDPACGSGAFLIKAVDILLEIHKEILNLKQFLRPEKYSDNGQAKMDKWNEESEAKEIIESNIYGVDINPESVAITKLALFLKIAERGKKLSGLTNNIKVGNSLISDKSIDEMAFDWEEQFPEKFDVVIGNPPYVRIQTLEKNQVNYFNTKYKSPTGNYDLYILFIERGYNLLKEKGNLSFILSNKFIQATSGKNIRKFISQKRALKSIINFGSNQIFEGVSTYTCILHLKNKKNEKFYYKHYNLGDDFRDLSSIDYIIHSAEILDKDKWNFSNAQTKRVLAKIESQKNKFNSITKKIFKGSSTGNDKIFLLDLIKKGKNSSTVFSSEVKQDVEIENMLLRPFLSGEDIRRYTPLKSSQVLLFPYSSIDGVTKLIPIDTLKTNFPKAFDYLNREYIKEAEGEAEKTTVKKQLLKRKSVKLADGNFYKYSAARSISEYEQPKIMIPDMLGKIRVNYDNKKIYYHGPAIHSVVFEDEFARISPYFYLGILNSKLFWFFITNTSTALQRNTYRLTPVFLNPFCFPEVNTSNIEMHDKLVNQVELILQLHNKLQNETQINQKSEIEKKISKADCAIEEEVYKLYGITEEEKNIIESI